MVIKKKTVFIIDDDSDFVALAGSILEHKGMEVLFSHTIKDALEMLEVVEPDLILLDLRLGNEHGVQFLAQRFNDRALSQIPIIVCSSENSAPMIKSILKFKSVDYLLKPIKPSWLVQRVRKALLIKNALRVNLEDEILGVEIDAELKDVQEGNYIIESNIGFEKDIVVEIELKNIAKYSSLFSDIKKDNTRNLAYLKTYEKSHYNKNGAYETMLKLSGITQDDKVRISLLKSFWRFDE